MDTIAAATGGHAYYSNNRPSELIDKALEHGESYYTLSYSPQNSEFRRVGAADPCCSR